ncbi:MAG TPA: MFS transporter [Bryobacteraceae bacterium]|nr:MFS transporter [Bryobacteraceae bacterium]
MTERSWRWFAIAVLILSSALNYLDRSLLSVLMPTLRVEYQIGNEELGYIVSAFSITYALMSPVMGLLVDRIGLRYGASAVVALWSAVGIGTGFAGTLVALMICRALLGAAESGGIPVTAKGAAVYLEPEDRALGSAVSQFGITLGTMAAPILTEYVSPRFGWRSAFVIAGALGFVWIPLWLAISKRVPVARVHSDPPRISAATMLRDRGFQALIAANILAMTVYSLWLTWLTLFLATRYRLTQTEANLQYAWIPPIFASLGGLFGGWLSQRLIRGGGALVATRLRIATVASLFALFTGVAPYAPSPALAVAAVCVSLFALVCLSVNYYSIPLDLFGAERAAFGVSFLTGAFGLMTVFLAPQIGRWSERRGWEPVCVAVAALPLISVLMLRVAFRGREV